MKVTEYFEKAKGKTLVSFEVLPPLKGGSIHSLFDQLDPLMEFQPPFIDVTYHREEFIYNLQPSGYYQKIAIRKRPGTVGICAAIMNRYKGGHEHAIDLIKQIDSMNQGIYLDSNISNGSPVDFCIGVAGYPEKHFESPSLKSDLKFLKKKMDAGGDYIVTQMFFDNQKYFDYVKLCREEGIDVPIVPGIKPITKKYQLTAIPRNFFIEMPNDLVKSIQKAKTDEAIKEAGIEWCVHQSLELKKAGVPCIHYYTMSDREVISKIVKQIM